MSAANIPSNAVLSSLIIGAHDRVNKAKERLRIAVLNGDVSGCHLVFADLSVAEVSLDAACALIAGDK